MDFYNQVEQYKYIENYATVRLDDDDILCRNFSKILNKYSDQSGKVISFPNGNEYLIKKGRKKIGKKLNLKNLALGLSGININIYNCGDHSNINTRYKVIYDLTPKVYLLNCSNFCDTKRQYIGRDFFYFFKFFINYILNYIGCKIISKNSLNTNMNEGYYLPIIKPIKYLNKFLGYMGYTLIYLK